MANNFAADATCVLVYNMESGALTTDSKGSNTLTNPGSFITADTVNFMQGAASAKSTAATQGLTIADADLDAGVPGKNGTGNTSFSFCMWSRHTTLNTSNGLVGKYSAVAGARSYFIEVDDNAGDKQVRAVIGYNGGASAEVLGQHTGTNIVVNQKYHTGVTYDAVTGAWRIRVYDKTGDTVSESTGTAAQVMSPDVANFEIFDKSNPDGDGTVGQIDEVVGWNRAITADEIDEVRQGIFGAGAAAAGSALFLGSNF